MSKKEVYYKFIFPTYESLSKNTDDPDKFVPENDGKDQKGEVRALCNECPERVITYDKLDSTLKSYVDAWVSIPKYFNLRNYMDKQPCQEGGMSLIVSHTPENLGNSWTKFKVGTKTIYCSLVISSGDFFYGFTLPDEVIEKSGLRDEVVKLTQFNVKNGKILLLRFHSNWCLNTKEKYAYSEGGGGNQQVGQEKRIFVQHYFKDNFNYSVQTSDNAFYRVDFTDNNDNIYAPFSSNIHCIDILGNDKDEQGYTYTGSFKNLPPPDYVKYYYINEDALDNRLSIHESTSDKSEVIRVVEHASDYAEDLKHDFIDLEATRRILFYGDGARLYYNDSWRDIHPTRDIPRIVDGTENTGTATVLSYEPPDEYLDKDYTYTYNSLTANGDLSQNTYIVRGTPPLQIPYNLLRYCLNDRPPFSDCETVLVMWIADRDPNTVADGDVAALHGLNWQQYAIPISCRCCFKEDDTCNTDRFLVTYPYGKTSVAKKDYALHFRRTSKYDGSPKEALFLQDLIRYSNDYIISYRNTSYTTSIDTQMRLFENEDIECCALYVRKEYVNSVDNRENQTYYVKVDESLYDVNDIKQFTPNKVEKKNYEKWDLDDNDWAINNNWIIALFEFSSAEFSKPYGTLTLEDSEDLRDHLNDIAPPPEDAAWSWNDIYISSLGISPCNQTNGDFMKLTGSTRGSTTMLPLDVLDGHIKIGSITYGSKLTTTSTTKKAIVLSFKDMFDYKYDGLYHFRYDEESNSYKSVISTYNSSTGNYDFTESTVTCTAYVEYL